jgi:uncharacterized membrane protein
VKLYFLIILLSVTPFFALAQVPVETDETPIIRSHSDSVQIAISYELAKARARIIDNDFEISLLVGATIGGVVGSLLPYIGTISGAIAGAIVGTLVYCVIKVKYLLHHHNRTQHVLSHSSW